MFYLEKKKDNLLLISILLIDIFLTFTHKISVAIFFLILFLILNIIKKDSILVYTYLIGVLVVFFFYYYWEYYYGLPYFLGKETDDWNYDILWTKGYSKTYGLNFSYLTYHLNEISSGLGILHNSKGYLVVIIFFRWISSFVDGYHTLIPRIFNVFVLSLVAHYSSLITYFYTKNKKSSSIVLYTVFFFPVMLFNSVHVFRDTIISFLIVYLFYIIIKRKFSISILMKILIGLYCLFFFRVSTFIVTVLMILILYFNPKGINTRFITLLLILIFSVIYFLEDVYFDLLKQLDNYEQLNSERFGYVGSKIFDLPIHIGFLPRMIYLMFTPVPNFSGLHQVYVSITAFLQVFSFPLLFLGLISKKIELRLKLVFMIFFMGVALSTAAFRHVMMYLPFGIIITIMTGFQLKNKISINKYLSLILLLFFIFIISLGVAFYY